MSCSASTWASASAAPAPISPRTPIAPAIAATARSGSRTSASSTHHVPSVDWSTSSAAAWSARRVLPEPPAPTIVTRRFARTRSATVAMSSSRPTKLDSWIGKVVAVRVQRVERREVVRQPRPGHLIDALGAGEIAQTMLAEVEQRDLVAEMVDDEIAGGLRDQDLAAIGDRAQPRRSNDRLARIVAVGRGAGLPRMDRHSHPQRRRSRPTLRRQRSLCFDRRQHRIRRPRERRHDRVALALRERTHATMR